MNIFNLSKFYLNKISMAYTNWMNLPLNEFVIQDVNKPYTAEAEMMKLEDRAFVTVAGEAKTSSDRCVAGCMNVYGVEKPIAEQMVHVWVAYHKDYGGYTATVAPYKSSGFWHGKQHAITEAVDKFYFGVKRTIHKTPKGVQVSAKKNIKKFKDKFSSPEQPIEFNLDELKLVMMREPQLAAEERAKRMVGRQRGLRKTEVAGLLTNLDPDSAEFIRYFQQNEINVDPETNEVQATFNGVVPVGGTQAYMLLNAKGFDKLLRTYVNEWYQKAIRSFAVRFGMTDQEVVELAIKNEHNIKNEQKALASEPAVAQLPAGDVVADSQLHQTKIAVRSKTYDIVNPEDFSMQNLYNKTKSLFEEAAEGINDLNATPEERVESERATKIRFPLGETTIQTLEDEHGEVYERQNRAKERMYTDYGKMPSFGDKTFKALFGSAGATGVERSADLSQRKSKLEAEIKNIVDRYVGDPALLTAENVANVLLRDKKRARAIAKNNTMEDFVAHVDSLMDSIKEKQGAVQGGDLGIEESESFHSDLQSALMEAKMKFSQAAKTKDPVTGAFYKLDPKMVDTFSIPYNITEQDLKKMRARKLAKEQGREVEDFPIFEGEKPEVKEPEGQKQIAPPPEAIELLGPQGQRLNVPPEQMASNNARKVIVSTLKSLIKIAEEMDKEGKEDAAEEIHKVIRKYQERI